MTSDLLKKLQLKAGQRVAILDPPEGYEARLAGELEGVILGEAEGTPDGVLAFVTSRAATLERAPQAFDLVAEGGLVWLLYPKGGSGIATDLNRDVLWKTLAHSGWRPVRQIALDDTWSAMRFRPEADIGR